MSFYSALSHIIESKHTLFHGIFSSNYSAGQSFLTAPTQPNLRANLHHVTCKHIC